MTCAAALIIILAGLAIDSVDEGLAQLEAGQVPAQVPHHVAREAALRIDPSLSSRRVRDLAALARQGGTTAPLAQRLVAVVAAGGQAESVALEELGRLPRDEARAAVTPLSAERMGSLLQLAARGASPEAGGALVLLAAQTDPRALVDLLRSWGDLDDPTSRLLLEELARTPDPERCFMALVDLELSPALLGAAEETLRALVARSPAVAERATVMVERGEHGQGSIVLRSLGGVALSQGPSFERAAAALEALLADLDQLPAAAQVAAIGAAGDLLLARLVPLLPALVQRGPPVPVRVAALRACAQVCYRDRPTIERLIGLLDDPQPLVAFAAYEALRRKSGKDLPAEAAMWTRWCEGAELPESAPEPDEVRLERERGLRLKAARRRAQRGLPEPNWASEAGRRRGGLGEGAGGTFALTTLPGETGAAPPAAASSPAASAAPAAPAAPVARWPRWLGLVAGAVVVVLVLSTIAARERPRSVQPLVSTRSASRIEVERADLEQQALGVQLPGARLATGWHARPGAPSTGRLLRPSARVQRPDGDAPTDAELEQVRQASHRYEQGLAALLADAMAEVAPPADAPRSPRSPGEPGTDSVGHLVIPAARPEAPGPPSASELDARTVPAARLFASAPLVIPSAPPAPPPAAPFPLDAGTVPVAELFSGGVGPAPLALTLPPPPPPPAPLLDPRTVPVAQLFGAPASPPPPPPPPPPAPLPPPSTGLTMHQVLGLTQLWKRLSEPLSPAERRSWEQERTALEGVLAVTPEGRQSLELLAHAHACACQGGRTGPDTERAWAQALGQLFQLLARS